MMNEVRMPFDESGWASHRTLRIRENLGIARDEEIIDIAFDIPTDGLRPAEFRVVHNEDGHLVEVPSQFYGLEKSSGRVAFRVQKFAARQEREYRIYYGNPAAQAPQYLSSLKITKGGDGQQHEIIENDYYRIERMPKSGQIWHVWNKKGSNRSWHHNEWDDNKDKGGDPCHWAPNCWAAYPERITNGYDVVPGYDTDLIDWNYAFGWDNPETQIITGPIFHEITRRGVVWPHPEHTNREVKRDPSAFIHAQVTYRFYDSLPWFHQSSVLETLKDMRCFFIRNCQFVFLADIFSHSFAAPERDGILPADEEDVAVLRLMGHSDTKPYPHQQHSYSNILPSKVAYYGYYNDKTSDGFALFQLEEKNSNKFRGEPVYQNHVTLFSELAGWSCYYCRSFSYTNQRYNPENVAFLPKGERYEEVNTCLIFRHQGVAETLAEMKNLDQRLKNPLETELV